MLIDADRSLARWLEEAVLPTGTVVRWTPERAGAANVGAPYVAALLHAVRREDQVQQSSWTDVRDERGRVIGRQAPLQHYRLTYLVAACAPESESDRVRAEHELLGALIAACSLHDVVPPEYVEGVLAAAGVPTLVLCAPTEPAVAEPHWDGWGISPRTYLRLDLLAPLLPPMAVELAPAVRELALGTSDVNAPGAGTGTGTGAKARVRAVSRPSPLRS